MNKELTLKNRDLNWLGKAFGDNSLISPFKLSQEEEFTAGDKKRLIDIGVIGEDNNVKADYFPMLDILSGADGYIQVVFSRGPVMAKKTILTKKDEKVSLIYKADEAVINMPSNPYGMVEYLKDFMGSSKLTGSDLSLDEDAADVLTFAVIADLYKREVLKAYAAEEVFVCPGFKKQDILNSVNNIRANSQSLSYHVFVLNSGFEKFTIEKVEEILNSLISKGLIKREEEFYMLQGDALLFAGNFLVIENIIEVIVGQVKDDKLFRSNFLLIQAGPLDVVYLEKSDNKIFLECMSSLNAQTLLSTVLSEKPNII
ncbi:MAG: hypothetical protein SA378_05240 [Sedimentibacter sp.]|uniref:hypothetical protein n=1 Tax=Sedimentibacter sp. TaxID=1960295 RepID=UPI00298207D0|nr:hypothetical protein [Sedimentibacter sp.]MDW5299526.1 hypothetical protein [Sedimentibacter sp.]